jgi:hypothetical protein
MIPTNTTPVAEPAIPSRRCPICGTSFLPARRAQRACNSACKQALFRAEKRNENPENGPLYQTAQNSENHGSQVIEKIEGSVPVFEHFEDRTPTFERGNDVTYKITDGVKVRDVGAAQWARGGDHGRALGWLMEIGWIAGESAWCVRIGNLSYGPTSLARAKSAAVAIVRGGFTEPVQRVSNPSAHLNAMQAKLLARSTAPATLSEEVAL